MRVTLGQRAGPAVVTAKVRNLARTSTVYADPGPPSALAVLRDSGVVTGSLTLASRHPVVLRVVARDRYGNLTALRGFQAVATGEALRAKIASPTDSEGVVTLEPRRTGAGQLEIHGSGLATQLRVEVTLPVAAAGWVLGARGSWAGFSYGFTPFSFIQGRPGIRGELYAGRAVTSRLRLELVGAVGILHADTAPGEVAVALTEGFVRGEYALLTEGVWTPVVTLGGGLFRILSNDPGHIVYHTSLFASAGGGLDFILGRGVTGEVRVETHQMNEMTSKHVNGYVGALTVVEAGVRLTR